MAVPPRSMAAPPPAGGAAPPPASPPIPPRRKKSIPARVGGLLLRLFFAVGGFVVFVFGIQLMKTAASQLRGLLVGVLGPFTDTPLHSLAFGWLVAYVVLSGSPVAAFALGLLTASPPIVSTTSAYFMIMGSRLGASFIVIIIGLVAIARGAEREKSLAMGVLSFLVTYSIYLPAILLGYVLLNTGLVSWLQISTPPFIVGYFQFVYERPVGFVIRNTSFFPVLAFVAALIAVYAGLALFDKTFHREEQAEVRSPRMHRFMRHLPVSFLIGALITLASTSVSLSIGMLVPLYLRGYLDRREIVPYIMGANITTFIDTLFAAIVLGGPVASNLVLIEMLSVTTVSLFALAGYRRYSAAIDRAYTFVFRSNWALGGFGALILAAPLLLLFLT